ncbi:MAG: heparinase II/III-family protein [Chitinispirillaceae bacterium]|nr:heparinase II/III-family protein [Chitinispirillaceae bacterium]
MSKCIPFLSKKRTSLFRILTEIFYYFEVVRRFSPKQLVHLIWYRVERLIPGRFLFLVYSSTTKDKLWCDAPKCRNIIEKIGRLPGKRASGLLETFNNDYLLSILQTRIQACGESSLHVSKDMVKRLFDSDGMEYEAAHNLHRFWMFDAFFELLAIPGNIRIELIITWIDVYQLSEVAYARDCFSMTMRLLNWIFIIGSLSEEDYRNCPDKEKLGKSIQWQIRYIDRHIERHNPGNHVIIQLCLLWVLYNAFYDNPKRCAVLDRHIEKEICRQFDTTGFHREQCFHYHTQVTLTCLLWRVLKTEQKSSVSATTDAILVNAINLTKNFIFSESEFPAFGDSCYPFYNFNRQEDLQSIALLGSKIYENRQSEPIRDNPGVVKTNSYVICTNRKTKIIADIGELGPVENAGHAHADMLSFMYMDNGVMLFTDPGTRTYDNHQESCMLKNSAMHNTISLDGESPAKLWRYFRWVSLPQLLESSISEDSISQRITINGCYKGWKWLGGGMHQRTFVMSNGVLRIDDGVTVNKRCILGVHFIVGENVKTATDNDCIFLEACGNTWKMSFTFPAEMRIDLEKCAIYKTYNSAVLSDRISAYCSIDGKGTWKFSTQIESVNDSYGK